MTDIVKKLYHQSVEDMTKTPVYPTAWAWENRFAELIVLECLKTFEGSVPFMQYEYAASNIKRKFGIT
jgi:hypothetical protein